MALTPKRKGGKGDRKGKIGKTKKRKKKRGKKRNDKQTKKKKERIKKKDYLCGNELCAECVVSSTKRKKKKGRNL